MQDVERLGRSASEVIRPRHHVWMTCGGRERRDRLASPAKASSGGALRKPRHRRVYYIGSAQPL